MSEQEEKELRDEIFQEEMMREELRKLSSEDLVHVDNIITGLNKLRESKPTSMSFWMMITLWILGIPLPMEGFNGIMIPNKKEDETDKPKL